MLRFLEGLSKDDSGQDATEYVLLVVLIALAVVGGFAILATDLNGLFADAGERL